MERTIANNLKFKKPAYGAFPQKNEFSYNESRYAENVSINLRGRVLAFTIFLYYFIENGTLGLIPPKYYMLYRNIRISDFILYALILYSFFNIREYGQLFKSKSFLITKILLCYFIFEFGISAIKYQFNIIEYFFRLKGLWTSFLVFPFLLLYKRNGFLFLIKILFPVAVISNILYILTALTGIPFIPDVAIFTQTLPGGIEVFRVYGGTFYGEIFYLGFIYFWITKRFRAWQIIPVVLFIIPHILAFGRTAWASLAFTIFLMILINSLKKRNFKLIFRQVIIIVILFISTLICFIEFIPESQHFIDAVKTRIFEGEEDIKYNEGTYGTRTLFQNDALLRLWNNSDKILGIGMNPMWVYGPSSYEEQVYYNAFCDVGWTAVLAAYGIIGFILALIFQIYYIFTTFKILKKIRESNLQSFFIIIVLSKFLFDSLVTFSYAFFSVGLWGMFGTLSFYIAVVVYNYERENMGIKN